MIRSILLSIVRLSALASLLAPGCAGRSQSAPQSSSPAVAEALAEPPAARVVGMIEALAQAAAGARDCDQLATELARWTGAHKDTYPELSRAAGQDLLAASERHGYQDRLDTALTAVLSAVTDCQEHAAALLAFDDLDALLDP